VISYAQNCEDVVLARLFAGRATGRYVDIGAGDPVEASTTRHFYGLGWRGVNVEPIPSLVERLRMDRPQDVNLAVAVAETPGRAVLHVIAHEWGWSTLDSELAHGYEQHRGWQVRQIEVEVVTLATVLNEHPGPVDFLKIDVEGAEAQVIAGADWDRHRPRVLVVEATEPGAPVPSHHKWEPTLLRAGYRCALFDGLNRFYAQADDDEALERLAAPANVFDEYEPHWKAQFLADVAAGAAGQAGYLKRLEAVIAAATLARERDARTIAELTEAVRRLERQNQAAERDRDRLRAALDEL